MMTPHLRPIRGRSEAGFTLMEIMITLAITMLIMAGTLRAMNDALRASEVAQKTTAMNQGLRTAMDIMVRDLLQVGQGLPSTKTIDIPNGSGATAVNLPTRPGATQRTLSGQTVITAVVPGTGLGPTINGVATDVITIILADGAFLSDISDYDVGLTGLTATTMTVDSSVDISNGGADDLKVGDLIMLQKTSGTALVQITALDGAQTATFGASGSLNLNQTAAAAGTLTKYIAKAPVDSCTGSGCLLPYSTATRIRMISYYIDANTDPARPRLVRRINDNPGTVLAFDVENLRLSYDLVTASSTPAEVTFNAADLAGTGRCSPSACSPNQIRKINLTLTGRSRTVLRQTGQFLKNTLTTQVSLRSMAFKDRYPAQ
jgi:type IV pilus assembly protein PilW